MDGDVRRHPFEISMNNPELVEVGSPGHYFRELKDVEDNECGRHGEAAGGLANCNRFTSGLDLVYSTTFPFCIQSVTMRKYRGSAETETPSRVKMLGCDRCFQLMISRQNL